MKPKMKVKMGIDLLMTITLLGLMAYQITGQRLHEQLGAGMLALFLFHNLLNLRWYKNLLKGRYKPLRILQTMVNFSVLASMLCLGYSGIVLSRYVFPDVNGPMATARRMHLAVSYWGFVLMSVHLGMHWGMIQGMFRKLVASKRMPSALIWLSRAAAVGIACCGLYCFIEKDIISYMLLQTQFVFFDSEPSAAFVVTELLAMMGFWIFIGYYFAKAAGKINRK